MTDPFGDPFFVDPRLELVEKLFPERGHHPVHPECVGLGRGNCARRPPVEWLTCWVCHGRYKAGTQCSHRRPPPWR